MFEDFDNVVRLKDQCENTLIVETVDYTTILAVQTRDGHTVRLTVRDLGGHVSITAHLEPGETLGFGAVSNDADCRCIPLAIPAISRYDAAAQSMVTVPELPLGDGHSVIARYPESSAS